MNFKQQLIEESKKLKYLDVLHEDIEFIKQQMILSSGAREYVIYLTKKVTPTDRRVRRGDCGVTLCAPRGVKHRVYYEAIIAALKELGFDCDDINCYEDADFYRIWVSWY